MSMQPDIASHIKEYGHSVLAIFGTATAPPFAYTIGFTETYLHPELLVFGLRPEWAKDLFNIVSREIKDGRRLNDGDILEDVANLPCAVKHIMSSEAKQYAFQAVARYAQLRVRPSFQQLVLPDANGLFPWQPGYAESMKKCQPELWLTLN